MNPIIVPFQGSEPQHSKQIQKLQSHISYQQNQRHRSSRGHTVINQVFFGQVCQLALEQRDLSTRES